MRGPAKPKISAGDRFGSLTVLRPAERPEGVTSRYKYWHCSCGCGGRAVVRGASLNSGNTTSCGCANVEMRQSQGRMLTLGDETLCVSEWARRLGMGRTTLAARIRLGWSDQEALCTPVEKK